MAVCPFNPASETIADFIYRYGSGQLNLEDREQFPCVDTVNFDFAVIHLPLQEARPISLQHYPYYSIPSLFALLDNGAMEASGILSVFNAPALSNMGQGTIVGIVDTGIDYTNPLFRNNDGTTRILGIWDQSYPLEEDQLPPGVPDYFENSGASYGTEYTMEQIDEALASENPAALVPELDENGHGTFLAGIAAGGSLPEQDFTGAAPRAGLAVVKLRPAKQYLRDFYLVAETADAYQEDDIMMGIKYLRVMAGRLRRPLVILLGLGTNLGSHEGHSPLSILLQSYSGFFGIASVIAAGNETGLAHHFLGDISSGNEWENVEVRVGEEEARRGFVMELWASNADIYSVGFISPSGEQIGRIPIISGNETVIPFLLEPTKITVNYQLIDPGSGKEMIFLRFDAPSTGIWTIRVYNTQLLTGTYHMWLPVQGHISDETAFLRPNPYNTITVPGNTNSPITAGAYNHLNDSIYIHSSRGYALDGTIKPELAAPGVDVTGPIAGRSGGLGRRNLNTISPALESSAAPLTTRTGTSVSAAITAGAVANLLSWGIVEGNYPNMSEISIKSYLIRGAKRNPALTYPNREWGYGALDLFQTFLHLRE